MVDAGLQRDIFVADSAKDQILEFNSERKLLRQFGSEGSGEGQFKGIGAIAANSAGDVYVTDPGNHRVQEFGPAGEHLRSFGSSTLKGGQLLAPTGSRSTPPATSGPKRSAR